jgi:hypothetical protein
MDEEVGEVNTEVLKETVVNMAIESWRFARTFDRVLLKLDAGETKRYKSQFLWFMKKIEGHPFDPGMAATPLNIEEFEPNDTLVVDQMLEPIIMSKDGLVKTGTVTLRKV